MILNEGVAFKGQYVASVLSPSFFRCDSRPTIKMNEQFLELVAIFSTTTLMGLGLAYVLKLFNLPFIWMHQVGL